MPTREAINGKLRKERERLVAWYREQPADVVGAIATESEMAGGDPWTSKDHLAHLAMIERNFQRMIRRHVAGTENPVGLPGRNREDVIAGVHRNNQANVDSHRHDDLDTLLADLDAARTDTLRLLGELTDDQLELVVPGAPWGGGTIGGILITNGYHEAQHLQWVQHGLASRSALR